MSSSDRGEVASGPVPAVHQGAALTVEESGGYEFFEFLHLQADRGLRPTHTGSGSGQSAGLTHGDERLQKRQVEKRRGHPTIYELFECIYQ